VRLVACPGCHVQYDTTGVTAAEFPCRCGTTVRNVLPAPVEAWIQRCASCGAHLPVDAERCEYCRSDVVRDPGRLALLCPECFARNPEQARFCACCGVAFRPEPVVADGEGPDCPCCTSPLAAQAVGGVPVHECAKCGRLWVPGERFDELVRRALDARSELPSTGLGAAQAPPAPRRVEATVAYRACPVCGSRMHRRNFGRRSGVIVDWCGPHGTWLDADELEHIAAFVRRGGLDPAPGTGDAAGGAGATPSGLRTPRQFEAWAQAERILAEARAEQERRRARLDPARSLLEFLRDVLG
jgi:Zn-finger nucleic acid-binding protein/ribosomal protein L40E